MIFYHNITKEQLNETCVVDLMDNYDDKDLLFKSESGDAIIHKLEQKEIDKLLKEYEDE